MVRTVLSMVKNGAPAEPIGEATGFGVLSETDVHGACRVLPDLRGLDLTLVGHADRIVSARCGEAQTPSRDLGYYRLEGARLSDAHLCDVDITRACGRPRRHQAKPDTDEH